MTRTATRALVLTADRQTAVSESFGHSVRRGQTCVPEGAHQSSAVAACPSSGISVAVVKRRPARARMHGQSAVLGGQQLRAPTSRHARACRR